MFRTLLSLLVGAAALSACASQDPRPRPGERPGFDGGLFARPGALFLAGMDTNGDYEVDRREFDAGLEAGFLAADSDGSGGVSPLEYQAWSARALGSKDALPGRIALDANADNQISRDEFGRGFSEVADGYGMTSRGRVQFADLVRNVEAIRPESRGVNREVTYQRRR